MSDAYQTHKPYRNSLANYRGQRIWPIKLKVRTPIGAPSQARYQLVSAETIRTNPNLKVPKKLVAIPID